jgi:PKD repeat protein
VSQAIIISPASTLTPSFTYSPSSPAASQAVQFTDTSTGGPTSWLWNFGDNTTSTSQNPSHSYATAASYTVTLTVTNSSGSKSASQTVTVVPALTSSFNYSPTSPAQDQAVQFMDTSTGSPTSWQWDFGDSATSTIRNPSHAYAAAGPYWVNLTVTKGTSSNSTSQLVTVREPGIVRAASPSFADVSAAVSAAISGDTVIVPAGSGTWSSQLVITKGIYLIGAGIGNTVITANFFAPFPSITVNQGNYLISYAPTNPALNEGFRISGFTFNLNKKSFGLDVRNLTTTVVNKIRVDHNRIIDGYSLYDVPWAAVLFHVYGTIYGVVDNNVFMNGYVRCHGLDEVTWNNITFSFGTADNMYFEDNSFTSPDTMFFYGEMAGRYCTRYNTVDGSASTNGLYPFADMHPNQINTHVAAMGAEIYENIIDGGTKGVNLLDQRGGMALVYNNTVNSTSSGIALMVREETLDSLGWGAATNPVSGQPQHVSNSYYWGNKKDGATLIAASVSQTVNYGSPLGLVPQENREFWQQGATFDGSRGVGVGPLSSRPTTCTKGVAYWATDNKTLYKCTATNVWTEYYTPYTYPHPLRKLP